jgi:hypothetical protein
MIEVQLPDGSIAEFPDGTPPDTIKGVIRKRFPPTQAAQGAAAPVQNQGLALPGTTPTEGYYNEVPPNRRFGFSSSDTLNPLPALSTIGNNLAENVPIAGPALKQTGERVDAWLDNNIYRPLTGQPGTTTTEDVAATNAENDRQNPQAKVLGEVAGAVAPYAIAAEVPLLNQTLGFSGPWLQRLLMTGASQYAINTGDNLAHGQPIDQAAANAVMPALATMPFALLGKGPKPAGARADAIDTLKREGVPLTAGQSRGSKPLMTAESQLGGAAAQAFQDKQLAAFTKAALKHAGVNADNAGPEVIGAAFDKAGKRFDDLAALTTVKLDPKFQNDLLQIVGDYQQVVGTPAPALENMMNRISSIAAQNGGVIPGTSYKVLHTDLRTMIEGSNSEVKQALIKMKSSLDDAVERSVSGQTREAWQKVRQQYKNLVNITAAVSGAGELAASGLVRPANLRNAVAAGDKRNYAKGVGDLNELSRAGVIAMPAIPDSGTAGRLGAMATTGAGVAGLMGLAGQQGPSQLLTAAGAMAAPWAAGRAMLSPPGRALLSKGTNVPAVMARGISPLLAPQTPR